MGSDVVSLLAFLPLLFWLIKGVSPVLGETRRRPVLCHLPASTRSGSTAGAQHEATVTLPVWWADADRPNAAASGHGSRHGACEDSPTPASRARPLRPRQFLLGFSPELSFSLWSRHEGTHAHVRCLRSESQNRRERCAHTCRVGRGHPVPGAAVPEVKVAEGGHGARQQVEQPPVAGAVHDITAGPRARTSSPASGRLERGGKPGSPWTPTGGRRDTQTRASDPPLCSDRA